MPRFNIGDPVIVLAEYRRLYPGGGGIVVSVKPDALGRYQFDSYVIEFESRCRSSIYDFRLTRPHSSSALDRPADA